MAVWRLHTTPEGFDQCLEIRHCWMGWRSEVQVAGVSGGLDVAGVLVETSLAGREFAARVPPWLKNKAQWGFYSCSAQCADAALCALHAPMSEDTDLSWN